MTEAEELVLTSKVLALFNDAGIATMTRDELNWYLTAIVQGGYQLLRSVEGDDWVRGWLESAIEDLKNPPPISLRKPS